MVVNHHIFPRSTQLTESMLGFHSFSRFTEYLLYYTLCSKHILQQGINNSPLSCSMDSGGWKKKNRKKYQQLIFSMSDKCYREKQVVASYDKVQSVSVGFNSQNRLEKNHLLGRKLETRLLKWLSASKWMRNLLRVQTAWETVNQTINP